MDIDEQLNGTALPVLRVMLNSGPSSIDNPFQGITVDNAHSTASGSEINKTNKKRKTRTRKSKSNTSAYTPEEMALNEPDGEDLTVFN
jgi:hypothetical protein